MSSRQLPARVVSNRGANRIRSATIKPVPKRVEPLRAGFAMGHVDILGSGLDNFAATDVPALAARFTPFDFCTQYLSLAGNQDFHLFHR
jgi:hypothetical protein